MNDQISYHVRVRGMTLGPFRLQQMQQLIERGQLTRVHEVSKDGVTWERAANFPELFPPARIETGAGEAVQMASAASASDATASQTPQPVPAEGSASWYYVVSNKEYGPVSQAAMVRLLEDGVVSEETLVWSEGMAEWQPLRTTLFAEYLRPKQNMISLAGAASSQPGQVKELPEETARLLLDCRLWSGIYAVAALIVLLILVGIALFSLATAPSVTVRLGSVVDVLVGCAMVVATIFIFRANAAIAPMRYMASFTQLDRILGHWKVFWMISAIALAVLLTFVLLALMFILALGIDLATLRYPRPT